MAHVISCGVVILNTRREVFACHVTGTARWDLPKGVQDPGETPLQTALRETWEETSLDLEAALLEDLGSFDYLPAKRLHLFAVRVTRCSRSRIAMLRSATAAATGWPEYV